MINYSWQDIESLNKKLSKKIKIKPNIIIGILRGGSIPARLLAKSLEVKQMYSLTIRKDNGERSVRTEILDDIKNKKILLVEDVLESGRSLIIGKKYLENKLAIVKTASYFILSHSEVIPDFYIGKINKKPIFPWD
jgi:hypoxanthine phosphoribosyltransferase